MSVRSLRNDKKGVSRMVKPVAVLMQRLRDQSAEGGLIEGMKVHDFPIYRIEGVDDLPSIAPVEYTDMDVPHIAGAKTGKDKTSNNILQPECTLTFLMALTRETGIFSEESPWGVVNWVERVKDSLETASDGSEDLMLNYSCMKPMYIHTREPEITDLAWTVLLECEFYPMPLQRGSRHYVWSWEN